MRTTLNRSRQYFLGTPHTLKPYCEGDTPYKLGVQRFTHASCLRNPPITVIRSPNCLRLVRLATCCLVALTVTISSLTSGLALAQEAPKEGSEADVVYDDSNTEQTAQQNPATPESQTSQPQRAVNTFNTVHTKKQALLADEITTPVPVWLTVAEGQQLAFWQEDLSGKPQGAVLLITRAGDTPTERSVFATLQKQLPKHGWATLAISAPQPIPISIPPRPTAQAASSATNTEPADTAENTESDTTTDETQVVFEDQEAKNNNSATTQNPAQEDAAEKEDLASSDTATSQDNNRTWEDYTKETAELLTAAIAYLQEQGQYNIALLGEGLGAYAGLAFLNSGTVETPDVKSLSKNKQTAMIDRPIRAVLVMNIQHPKELTPATMLLTTPEIPTLDLTTQTSSLALQQAEQRKLYATKNGYQTYVIKSTTPVSREATERKTAKIIRGFLKRYASGVELK